MEDSDKPMPQKAEESSPPAQDKALSGEGFARQCFAESSSVTLVSLEDLYNREEGREKAALGREENLPDLGTKPEEAISPGPQEG